MFRALMLLEFRNFNRVDCNITKQADMIRTVFARARALMVFNYLSDYKTITWIFYTLTMRALLNSVRCNELARIVLTSSGASFAKVPEAR